MKPTSKSGSRIITKESLENYKEWSTPSVGNSASKGAVKIATRNPHLLTASQAGKVQKQAYDEAFAAGMKEGLEAGKQEAITRVQSLEKLMQSLVQPFQQLDQEVEDELVTLSIAIVKQLVRREIKTDPGQVVAVVREAVSALPVVSRSLRLHLHPEDAVVVQEALSLSESERAWTVVEDPSISRGGCRVISENSQVDATLETRLAQIIASVFGDERVSDDEGMNVKSAANATNTTTDTTSDAPTDEAKDDKTLDDKDA